VDRGTLPCWRYGNKKKRKVFQEIGKCPLGTWETLGTF
jgi:hypothetical protein